MYFPDFIKTHKKWQEPKPISTLYWSVCHFQHRVITPFKRKVNRVLYHLTLEVVNFRNYVNTKGFHKIQPSLRGKTNRKLLWIPNFWKQRKCNLTHPKVKSKHHIPLGIRAGYLVPPADHWEQATLGPPRQPSTRAPTPSTPHSWVSPTPTISPRVPPPTTDLVPPDQWLLSEDFSTSKC